MYWRKIYPLFFLCFIIFSASIKAQEVQVKVREWPAPGTETADTIYYSFQRPLSWKDFQGTVRRASPSAALTFAGISYDAAAKEKKDTISVQINLQIYFDKKGSWVRPGSKTTYALRHEQLHFDIAKMVGEQFKDTVSAAEFSPDNYAHEIDFLFLDYYRKLTRIEMQFDKESRHGMDHAAERKWENKVNTYFIQKNKGLSAQRGFTQKPVESK